MADRKGRGRGGHHRNDRKTQPAEQEDRHADTAGKPAEPAHAAAAEDQIEQRLFPCVLEDPEELAASHAAQDAGDAGVNTAGGQTVAAQFPLKQPQADKRADSNHHAETRDLEAADAEQDGVHIQSAAQPRSRSYIIFSRES